MISLYQIDKNFIFSCHVFLKFNFTPKSNSLTARTKHHDWRKVSDLKWLEIDLNCPPKTDVNYLPWLEKNVEINCLKWLKMDLNCFIWFNEIQCLNFHGLKKWSLSTPLKCWLIFTDLGQSKQCKSYFPGGEPRKDTTYTHLL